MARWPGAVALLSIGASYLALSDYVTVEPRVWLPALMTVLVVAQILTVVQCVLSLVVVIVLVAWAVGTL